MIEHLLSFIDARFAQRDNESLSDFALHPDLHQAKLEFIEIRNVPAAIRDIAYACHITKLK